MQALRRLTFDGFETITPDELVSRFTADFADLDALIAEAPDGPLKRRAMRHSAVAHRSLLAIHEDASETGGVSIMSPIPKPQ